MKPKEYELMYQIEKDHWWYSGMEALTRGILENRKIHIERKKILDAGCGTGGTASSYLGQYSRVTGCDISRIALSFCAKRNISTIAQASVTHLPFANQEFDMVVSFDVLYEQGVENDQAALAEFWQVLRPGGHLFLRLPAYNWLRSNHDQRIQTARRYTRSKVTSLLHEVGFSIRLISYANTFLFPFAVVKRILDRLLPVSKEKSDLEATPRWLNPYLAKILASESGLITGTGLPFGLSILALAQK